MTMVEFSANLLYQRKLAKRNQSQKENEIKPFRAILNPERNEIKDQQTEMEAKQLNKCLKYENVGRPFSETIDYLAFVISIGLFIVFNYSYFVGIAVA